MLDAASIVSTQRQKVEATDDAECKEEEVEKEVMQCSSNSSSSSRRRKASSSCTRVEATSCQS